MSQSLNSMVDHAMCKLAKAQEHWRLRRDVAVQHRQAEKDALVKVIEAQNEFDALVAQVREFPPDGTPWANKIISG